MEMLLDINDQLLQEAMRAGSCQTREQAVEAGLRLLAQQAVYREVLKWKGKLNWEAPDWQAPAPVLNEMAPARYAALAKAAAHAEVPAEEAVARRKRRLKQLIAGEGRDGAAGLARKAGRAESGINHMARPGYHFGERAARSLEQDLGLTPGYFDAPDGADTSPSPGHKP